MKESEASRVVGKLLGECQEAGQVGGGGRREEARTSCRR